MLPIGYVYVPLNSVTTSMPSRNSSGTCAFSIFLQKQHRLPLIRCTRPSAEHIGLRNTRCPWVRRRAVALGSNSSPHHLQCLFILLLTSSLFLSYNILYSGNTEGIKDDPLVIPT